MKKKSAYLSILLIITLLFTSSTSSIFAKKAVGKPSAPVAENVTISGLPKVLQTLTGNYTYSDTNNDAEGKSKYRWLVSQSLSGTYSPILNATLSTYTLTENEVGKYIRFEVQPVSVKQPYNGTTILSAVFGPIAPIPVETQEPLPPPPPTKTVLGFATKYYSTDMSSYNSIASYGKSIDQIATVTYTADSYGNLIGAAPKEQIDLATQNGIKPLAMIGNDFNGAIVKSILENNTYRQRFINNVVNIIEANGYSGINLDFEGIYASNRNAYSGLIIDLKNVLSPHGYLFQVSVPAKTVDSPTNSWNGAFDYKIIGEYADQVLLMTYDEHGPWGASGPVASIGWVTNVVNYAQTVIPKEKILLGLAAYGYDWSSAGNKAHSINAINNLVSQKNINVKWDSVSQTPYFNYTDSSGVYHTVWYENSYSIGFKLNLVNERDLLGVGIWRLGLEDSGYWDRINSKLDK